MCSIVPESPFQFTTPVLSYFVFEPNEDFAIQSDQEIQTPIKMGVSVKKNDKTPEATVELTVEIGDREDKSPFYIRAVERGNFRWGNEFNDEMVKRLLDQNAPSLLLSYLRPVIVQVTTASQYGLQNIPFVNFSQFQETRQK